jgi:2-polyprenyl-3-methyl-5-hydroxy-6-metoxy-1,4-benzoquinol methylase
VKQYGFKTVSDFAASLPNGALVLDVAAGVSLLGHAVASLRPDVRWVNIDLIYKEVGLLARLAKDAPANVEFMVGDVVAFSPPLKKLKGQADVVLSYWLIPHLSLKELAPAEAAAKTMWELLKPGGQAFVGPLRQHIFRYDRALRFTKNDDKLKNAQALARASQLHPVPRAIQAVGNRYNLHVGNHLLAFVHGIRQKRSA